MSSKPRFAAHTPPKDQPDKWQTMREHTLGENGKTLGVLPLAVQFATGFGAGDWAKLAALLHDIGKYSDRFQNYLDTCHVFALQGQTYRVPSGGGDHKWAGAMHCCQMLGTNDFEAASLTILGHHGGLPQFHKVNNAEIKPSEKAIWQTCLERAREEMPEIGELSLPLALPEAAGKSLIARELFTRMLFSCLVDADSLDTEQHFQADKMAQRTWSASFADWEEIFTQNHAALQVSAEQGSQTELQQTVNAVRKEVYDACLQAAALPQGVYRLTVPTGGGKTRASLGFALAHARHHALRVQRVIYAIPYTSIIDQTVGVFQEIFGEDAPILVHHSAVPDEPKDKDDEETGDGASSWRRLASENWDAPLVVTTTVQLFESLFANKPSACRKLHNIANSVLILDEVQMLPPALMKPIIDVLKMLAKYYGVTVVLCTATQPAIVSKTSYLNGFKEVTDIVPQPEEHFRRMRRVKYHIEPEPLDWQQVAEMMSLHKPRQCVTVVNTRADALNLLAELQAQLGKDSPAIFHLSTLLCGAHRRYILDTIRLRLKAGDECLLASTQVIEAGVDLDFPYAKRAIAGLERMIQLAGRCNRNGRLAQGEVVIFTPSDGGLPPDFYRSATERTKILLQDPNLNFDDPAVCTAYFAQAYGDVPLDKFDIQLLRQSLDFPEVASRFRMINAPTRPVLVEYAPEKERYERLRSALDKRRVTREFWRNAQPLLVNVLVHDIERLEKSGGISDALPHAPGTLYLWHGTYDDTQGMVGILKDATDPIYHPNDFIL